MTVPFNTSSSRREGLRLRHQPDLDHPQRPSRRLLRRLLLRGQAVVALEGTAGAEATSLTSRGPAPGRADRHHLAHRDPRRHPADADPLVFEDTNIAKGVEERPGRRDPGRPADGVLHQRGGDRGSTIVGQFQVEGDATEEFGMLFEKGTVGVVRQRGLATLEADGTLARSRRSGSPTSWTCRLDAARDRAPGDPARRTPAPQRLRVAAEGHRARGVGVDLRRPLHRATTPTTTSTTRRTSSSPASSSR